MYSILSSITLLLWYTPIILGAPTLDASDNPFCTPFDTPPASPKEPPAVDRKDPGLGVEFETSGLEFKTAFNSDCTREKYYARKGQTISDEYGKDMRWWMSGDTTLDSWNEETKQGLLTAEYIMNGLKLQLGKSQAGPAAEEMTKSWDTRRYYDNPGKEVIIKAPKSDDDGCNKWFVTPESQGKQKAQFAVQVTVAMPLNAIDSLFKTTKTQPFTKHKLVAFGDGKKKKMVWVSSDFFLYHSQRIDGSGQGAAAVNGEDAEVRGFFSLLLTYAKHAHTANVDTSAKMLSSFMPRTNFVAMYNIIKPKLPANFDLYKMAKELACWENDPEEKDLSRTDESQENGLKWCEVDQAAGQMVPTARMDNAVFTMKGADNVQFTVSVKEWIENIASGTKDVLQEGDARVDKQIGALKERMEWVFGTKREAPIFEFRDLGSTEASGFKQYVEDAEKAALDLHKQFKDA